MKHKGNGIDDKRNEKVFECFPTLEDFARHLRDDNDNSKCAKDARAAIHGQTRIMVHLFGNYRKMAATIPNNATLYAIRTEHLWSDWFRINKLLDSTRNVFIPQDRHERNIKNLSLPVSRNVSKEGQVNLCRHLHEEYRVYFDVLERAANLNASDVKEALQVTKQHCPNLNVS